MADRNGNSVIRFMYEIASDTLADLASDQRGPCDNAESVEEDQLFGNGLLFICALEWFDPSWGYDWVPCCGHEHDGTEDLSSTREMYGRLVSRFEAIGMSASIEEGTPTELPDLLICDDPDMQYIYLRVGLKK